MSSLLRLAYTLGPGYARLLLEAAAAAGTPTSRQATVPALCQLLVECGALSDQPSLCGWLDWAWARRQREEAIVQQLWRVQATAAVILDQARHTAAGEDGVRALTALRHTVSGRTLLHLAALAGGRLTRLLTVAVPGLTAQVHTVDASGGAPIEAACSGCRRAEGLLHLVRCGAQVCDDSGALLAAALPVGPPEHNRCVLFDAFAAGGALVLLDPLGIGAARVSAPTAPPSEASVVPPLPWHQMLELNLGSLLLRRLLSWAPGSVDAWAASRLRAKGHDDSQWRVPPAFHVPHWLNYLHRTKHEAERMICELVRSGLAPAYAQQLTAAPSSLPAVRWTGHAARHLWPMLMRDTAWARRSPLVALRHMLRAQHEAALGEVEV
jgi:hypothetical protein